MNINLKKFYNNCVLFSIINAVMTLNTPEYSSFHSWDGENYNLNDWEGTRATVAFSNNFCVAAACDDNSPRLEEYTPAEDYFKIAPKEVAELADTEVLPYLLYDVEGKTLPLVTSAFWITQDNLYSLDDSSNLLNNGMHILENQMFATPEEIFDITFDEYEMSEQQLAFAKELFELKIKAGNESVTIKGKNYPNILKEGVDYSEGFISLGEVGIVVE